MGALHERGQRRSLFINPRSAISYLSLSTLLLTTVLALCSPVVATSDSTCCLDHHNPFSRPNSHSFILGRRAPRDEITIDTRAAPQRPHLERRQSDNDKDQPSDSSDDTSSSNQENNKGSSDDDSREDSSDNSETKKEKASETGKDDPPPTTTTTSTITNTDDRGSITETSAAGDLTITASGTISAATEIQTAPPIGSEDDLPTAFDTNLGTNFTNPNCPRFFREFLNNATFIDCHPVSLLIENSDAFFRISSSAPVLSQVLDASCAASQSTCASVMTDIASQLTDDANCGQDFENSQPLVRRAYNGLVTYESLYRASCLKNPLTHSYCFVDASTNTTNVEDSYIYLLALGFPFPGGTRPTCNRCLQATMEIFADAALVEGQPLVDTYLPAAKLININCGPNFVNTSVQVGTLPAVDAAPSLSRSSTWLMGYVSLLSVGVLMFL